MNPILIWMLLAVLFAGQGADRAEVQLQAAIKKEAFDGDLKGAIEQYQKIIANYASNRAVAAKALVRMGQCYEKLGSTEARKAYERTIRDFPDQKEMVAAAQARLTALGAAHSGVTYRQAWSGPKVDTEGTVSPDGRYLSYVDWDTGDLALHDFVTNSDRHLTNKGTWTQSDDFAEESAISRDGKQVAYSWFVKAKDRYEIRTAALPASGFLQPRLLFDKADVSWIGPYDWSPDGRWLAVQFQVGKDVSNRQIGLLSTQDGSLRTLSAGPRGSDRMFFSPDGKFLGIDLAADSNVERDVHVFSVDGTNKTKVVASPGQNLMMGWSPDGKRLLFASDRRGSMDLWALPVVDGKPQGTPELIRPDIAPWALGVTASGALYVGATISDRDIHIAAVDFSTGKLLSPPVRPIQTFVGSNMQPDWSPDGKYLAFVSVHGYVGGGDRVLAIRSVETGQVRELRPTLRAFNFPRWAPDGRSFVCQGQDSQGHEGIYRIDAATGEVAPIVLSPPGGTLQRPQWSSDGKRIFYFRHSLRTGENAWLERDLALGGDREIVGRKGKPFSSVSPDGRYLAVQNGDPFKSTAVSLIPIAGGEPLRVNFPQSLGPIETWTPDGKAIVVRKISADSEARECWLVPIDGRQPRSLEIGSYNYSPRDGFISVHPDGHRIAYVAGERKFEVWVLENFLPAAKTAR